jgi:Transglycosylase SLT domain
MLPALALGVSLVRDPNGARLNGRHVGARPRMQCPVQPYIRPEAGQTAQHFSSSSYPRSARSSQTAQDPAANPLVSRAADSGAFDPEVRRIQAALRRVEQDPIAREKFYAGVDSLILRVRKRQPIPQRMLVEAELPLAFEISASDPLNSAHAVAASFRHTAGSLRGPGVLETTPETQTVEGRPNDGISTPPLRAEAARLEPGGRAAIRPAAPLTPLPAVDTGTLLSPKGSALDPAVVARIVYWAQVNLCPIELALATAWQESRMSLHPPRGASGEVGIMQILPDRARIEGVDPASLADPETNLRLGTKLLARYYSEEGSIERAAMKYVAGPGVFDKHYARDLRDYIAWYSASVENYARFFGKYISF